MKLPESHRPFTDKYFLRTNLILQAEGLNPQVAMNVFTRGTGKVAGLKEAVEVLKRYSDLEQTGEVWVTNETNYQSQESLMIIKGPIQSFVELETMYLGILSAALSEVAGFAKPEPELVKKKLARLKQIYGDIPIIYFGARHYHWSLDQQIAAAALEGGAVQTSTDIGSSNIGLEGVGTTPHALILILASVYGKEEATRKTAELFDKHIPSEIPRVTLVDTFNQELTDGLMVAQYFGDRKNILRVDTCGENVGESGSLYQGQKITAPSYQVGTGVTIELVRNLKLQLIRNGFGNYTDILLSSGFGNEEKASAFVTAHQEFKEQTGYDLFTGVGIGEIASARFCTADIFEVDGKPMYKTGRLVTRIDYTKMERVI